MASWSKKLRAVVRKLSNEAVHPRYGITRPTSYCSSRSPCSGRKPRSCVWANVEHWPGHRIERRSLVVARVRAAQHPAQPRQRDRRADARVPGVLAEAAIEIREAQPAIQRPPRRYLPLLIHERRIHLSVWRATLWRNGVTLSSVDVTANVRLVLLAKGIDARAEIARTLHLRERRPGRLRNTRCGRPSCSADRSGPPTYAARLTWKNGEAVSSVPGPKECVHEPIAKPSCSRSRSRMPCGLLIGIVRHLIEVPAKAAIEAELILRCLVEDQRREASAAARPCCADSRASAGRARSP